MFRLRTEQQVSGQDVNMVVVRTVFNNRMSGATPATAAYDMIGWSIANRRYAVLGVDGTALRYRELAAATIHEEELNQLLAKTTKTHTY